MTSSQNYGQDAPGVVRCLTIGGTGLMVTALVVHGIRHRHGLHSALFWQPGATLLATAAWMVWSSRIGKRRKILALLRRHVWRGDEAVLDVGCGRGLATVATARLVPTGRVIGVDVWRGSDLSGNTPEAARANAQAAGVADRVAFETGNATDLPFADSTFDVVVSMTVFHNIRSADKRRRAVEEALRVLRPGGTLLIFDILHTPQYVVAATSAGAVRAHLSNPSFLWALPGWSMVAEKATAVG